MRVLTNWLLAAGLLAVGLAGPAPASAAVFTLTPSADPVTVGDSLSFTLAGAVTDLLAVSANFAFDAGRLALVSVVPAAGLPGAGDPNNTFVFGSGASRTLLFAGASPVSGTVDIITLVFRAVAAGAATVSFGPDASGAASNYEQDSGAVVEFTAGGQVTIRPGGTPPTSVPEPAVPVLLAGALLLATLRPRRTG